MGWVGCRGCEGVRNGWDGWGAVGVKGWGMDGMGGKEVGRGWERCGEMVRKRWREGGKGLGGEGEGMFRCSPGKHRKHRGVAHEIDGHSAHRGASTGCGQQPVAGGGWQGALLLSSAPRVRSRAHHISAPVRSASLMKPLRFLAKSFSWSRLTRNSSAI